ncbi:arrestin [Verticillium alfalfae VaMs.102]|uniref:Arrestin n=1 Tax=Verticillium alfalfae (strain VaMs.102 / ATCC MYA-4576 / FGSC 10136) TaxID=526221 RepID=C9S7Q9_VERA1|nr:arrestin [Verticillium alfalfae VaMs.102]EEY14794.1 arrestin [Verticillium alfalfae VaMs.102]
MSSVSDISSVFGSFARPPIPKGPSIEIKLDNHYNSKVYSSGSPVAGEVTITPWKDTRFDFVSIVLIGHSRTRLDAAQIAQHSSHTFLKLNMPIPASAYPVPRVFEAGHNRMPSMTSTCVCPPRWVPGARDDMSPQMARVEYMVKARVAEMPELGGRPIKVMEDHYHINVLPISPEDPPLNITSEDKGYRLTKAKTLRKNIFTAKQGRIIANAIQPPAIRLGADGRTASETSVTVNLTFEPTSPEIVPPNASHVSAKVHAATWFSAAPISSLPNMGDARHSYAALPQLSYSTSVSLFSDDLEKTQWQIRATNPSRRGPLATPARASPTATRTRTSRRAVAAASRRLQARHPSSMRTALHIPVQTYCGKRCTNDYIRPKLSVYLGRGIRGLRIEKMSLAPRAIFLNGPDVGRGVEDAYWVSMPVAGLRLLVADAWCGPATSQPASSGWRHGDWEV